MHQMRDADFSIEAIKNAMEDPAECVAEIDIGPDGEINILFVRSIKKCPSTSNGVSCCWKELHEHQHQGNTIDNGSIRILQWN